MNRTAIGPEDVAFLEHLRGATVPVVSDASGVPWLMLLTSGAVAAVAAAVVIIQRGRDRRRFGPETRAALRGLGLSSAEHRLLGRVAQLAGLRHPLSLVVSRGCFETACHRYVARFGDADRLRRIGHRMFG